LCPQKGQGCPSREPVVSEEQQKQMMAYYYNKQEEFKVNTCDKCTSALDVSERNAVFPLNFYVND